MAAPNNNSQDFPSLELAYDHLKGLLEGQAQLYESLRAKANNVWAAGTAITGVGIAWGLRGDPDNSYLLLVVLGASVLSYLVATILALLLYYPKRAIILMTNSTIIREEFWVLPEKAFKTEMLLHVERAWSTNNNVLNITGQIVRILSVVVLSETLLWLAWLGLTHWDILGRSG